jgi:uncharacterized membrane protein YeaQ/YmgE (transglycosylase-associated protein family)
MSGSSPVVNWMPFLLGFAAGMLSRLLSLQPGRREYPGWPSGYISQLALGIIAAMIGGGIITSLFAKEFTAATFLTLAATQFRDVRETERETLSNEESLILVPRGPGYIEGIAMTYEARNFLAMLVALATSAVAFWLGLLPGIGGGVVFVILGQVFMRGRSIGRELEVKAGQIHFEKESLLYVDNVMLMDVGLVQVREAWLEHGLGITLTPKSAQGQAILWNLGQRQAITHEAAMAVGVRKDVGYPDYTPLTRMDMPSGSGVAALAIVPAFKDIDRLIRAVQLTPMLEASKMSRVLSPTLLNDDGHSSQKGGSQHG